MEKERKGRVDVLFPNSLIIRVHQRAGGVVVCGVPDCALDSESLGNGVLMVYDLRYLRRRGRI